MWEPKNAHVYIKGVEVKTYHIQDLNEYFKMRHQFAKWSRMLIGAKRLHKAGKQEIGVE
jgi:hypothetical protein